MDGMQWPPYDVCGRSVPRAHGRLLQMEDDVTEYWDTRLNEERNRAGINQGQEVQQPEKATVIGQEANPMAWQWGHGECLPDIRYMVVAKRFDNIRMLLDWILHPTADDLVGRTNWRETG